MDVRCKLLGHVRDSTEFEERNEDRPRGTVLICREFQVCRRCGDREEMYRNEQVLSAESVEVDRSVVEGSAAPGGRGSDDGESRATERSAGGSADIPDEQPGVGGDGSPEAPGTTPGGPGSTDGSRPANADDETVDAGASPTETDRDSTAEADDGGQVTDDGVILSDSTPGPGSSEDARNRQAVADGRGPTSADRNRDDSPTSLFDAGDEDGGEVRCENCGGAWEQDDTSLRAGDICPECRGAYVQEG